jgi:hypothetical protein
VFCALLLLLQLVPGGQQAPRQYATVEGQVVDHTTGAPLAGVLVTSRIGGADNTTPASAERLQADSFDRPVVQVMTDGSGRFSVRVVAGRASVVFGKDLYGVRTLTYTLASGMRLQDAVVRLAPTGIISGRVVDSRNNPVPSARITPVQNRYMGRGQEYVAFPGLTTNDRGEFRLANVAPGEYLLSISSPASGVLYPGVTEVANAEYVNVASGKESRLKDVVLPTGSTSKGTVHVRLTNAPGEGAKDVAYTFTNITPNFLAPALDGNSVFEVSGGNSTPPTVHLEPSSTSTSSHVVSALGTYRATATWTDSNGVIARATATTLFAGADSTIDLIVRMPDARLSCRAVLEDADGRPSPLANINVMIRGAASCYTGADGTQALPPMHSGKYELSGFLGIPQDAYVVSATLGSQDALNGSFDVMRSSSSATLEVLIRRGAGVMTGKVVDSQGRIVHDAVVAAIPDSPAVRPLWALAYPSDRTDQNGVFEIRGLRPGAYRLYAWSVLDEAALRNPEFLKKFEGRGSEASVREREPTSKDLRIVDEPQ